MRVVAIAFSMLLLAGCGAPEAPPTAKAPAVPETPPAAQTMRASEPPLVATAQISETRPLVATAQISEPPPTPPAARPQETPLDLGPPGPAEYPAPTQGDYVIKDFRFRAGQTLPELRMHYRTIGTPQRDAAGNTRNAVLIMHGTTGAGSQFVARSFAAELFGKGQPLDATRYYLIMPDDVGHGQSSKPSDGLHARFPNYGYQDMVDAEYRLVTEGLHVNHLRLVMGTSMGGMHTWLWGEMYPDAMDALMPLASLPEQIAGRNRMWRKMISEAIRSDPAWNGGEYTQQPPNLRLVGGIMFFMGENPALQYRAAPTGPAADQLLDNYETNFVRTHDANNVLYAFEASRDYDPAPGLPKIKAPLLAINSEDDLINPPDQGILERQIKNVKNGRAVVIPEGPQTRGHGTHTLAAVWKRYLVEFLKQTEH